jgi:hypothetical protein
MFATMMLTIALRLKSHALALSLPLERERDTPIGEYNRLCFWVLYIVKSHLDPYEQEAIQFSCSRLQPMPCRWGECDIILNSVDMLIHHLNREHKPTGTVSFLFGNPLATSNGSHVLVFYL